MAGLQKEIWIDKLQERFYSKYDWLNRVDDWSKYSDNNTINFAAIGPNPTILKNNAVYPIVAAQRTDTALSVVMDYYDSTTTRIYWSREEVESSYDKLESVLKQHRQALLQEIVTECLWNYSPLTAAAGAFAATGANRAAVIGSQSTVASTLQISDILTLKERWDALDFPEEGRVMVLSVYHVRDLMAQDVTLFKAFADISSGKPISMYGFDFYVAANTPLYTKTTLAKKAYGAAADNVNDCVASVAFNVNEVMKAMGDIDMFYKEKGINPEQRADEVGFQLRFKGVPKQTINLYQQAIVSNRA